MFKNLRIIPLALAIATGWVAPTVDARPYCHAEPTFPKSAAGRCAGDFVAMVNDPTPGRIKAFETTWASRVRLEKTPVDERIGRVKALSDEWGRVTVTGVEEAKNGSVVVAATAAAGLSLELSFNMSPAEPGKLDSIDVEASSDHAQAQPLTSEVRAQTVTGVADALRAGYVFPEKGAKMADAILGKLKAGEYDSITGESALAKQLTDDCRAITNDRHLGIRVAPEGKSESHGGPSVEEMRRENYGFKKAEILPGNIGVLRFDFFAEEDEAKRTASSAINFLSGCDAIIFDLRSNGGGSPEMIRYITSYLFDSKTHLNDMVDRDSKIVEEYWTLEQVPGPRPKKDVPVFVLTSSRTFSGAEEFSYNLKNLKRATLVGETTGGGAHPVRGERVNERFVIRVPFMRAQNPITKTNWEGTGVEPDVKTGAGDALEKATELARQAIKSQPRK